MSDTPTTCKECGNPTKGDSALCFECWVASDSPENPRRYVMRAGIMAQSAAEQLSATLRDQIHEAAARVVGGDVQEYTAQVYDEALAMVESGETMQQTIGALALLGMATLSIEIARLAEDAADD